MDSKINQHYSVKMGLSDKSSTPLKATSAIILFVNNSNPLIKNYILEPDFKVIT